MTARPVRTTSTTTPVRRAPRLLLVAALVLSTISALGAATSAPAGAITPSVVHFTGETLGITADGAPGGSLNAIRALVVVQHDPGVTVTGMRRNNNGNVGGGFGGVEGTIRTFSTTYTVVEVSWTPGTGNWPGFGDRRKNFTACVELQVSTGAGLGQNCWGYSTASASQALTTQDYGTTRDNYNTTQGSVLSPTGTIHAAYVCDDPDTEGIFGSSDDSCDSSQIRVRNVSNGDIYDLACNTSSGPGCPDGGRFNADDNTRRDYDIPLPNVSRGKYVIEQRLCTEGGSCGHDWGNWGWLGFFYVNPSAPTVSLSGSASGGTATRPNTDAVVTYTANASSDSQIIDWDIDQNTGNGFEIREHGTTNPQNAPVLGSSQKVKTVNTALLGEGVNCGVRAQVTDNGSINAADQTRLQSGIATHSCTTNRRPTGSNQTVTVHQGSPFTINLSALDGDGDPTTCLVQTTVTKGTLSGNVPGSACSRTYTANMIANTTDSFTYRVFDDHNGLSTATYTVTINISNGGPTANAQSITVNAGQSTPVTLTGSDPDGDTLTCSIFATPTKGALGGSGCARTYTSNAGTANAGIGGTDSFEFQVNDALGGSPPATVGITIKNPDLSLTKSHTGRFNEGTGTGTYTLSVSNTANAPANGTTTLVDTLPAGMRFRSAAVGSSGFSCTGTPGVSTTVTCTRGTAIPVSTTLTLTITVDVIAGASSPSVNSATVSSLYELASTAANNTGTDSTDVNHRPTVPSQEVGTDVDVPVLIPLGATDPDGDALTYSVSGVSNGVLFGSGANRQYFPDSGFEGVDSFTVSVTDTGGLTSTVATITIYVGVRPVRGAVTDELTGQPISGVEARLVDMSDPQAGVLVGTVLTDGLGRYDFGSLFPDGVPSAPYAIRYVDPDNDYIPEWFEDAPTSATATLLDLSTEQGAVIRDVALTPGARIQGTVRSTAAPNPTIDGLQVRLVKIGSTGSGAKTTADGGRYKFELLREGTYQLWFRDLSSGQWVSEWYSDAASQEVSTTIIVGTGAQLVIDEQITPVAPPPPPDSGSITGTVRSRAPGNAPIPGIQVRAYLDPYTVSKATTTDANGQYSFTRLAPGSWKIWFRDVSSGEWVSQYNGEASTLAESDAITLANDGHIVDALLAPKNAPVAPTTKGTVSGTVTEIDGFTPVVGIQVRVYINGQTGSTATTTNGLGQYSVAMVPGQYQVWFRDLSGAWISEWNLDKPGQPSADPITVTSGGTTTVNASLVRK